MLVRSLLFAPANRPDLFGKFPRLEADLFALDLEDGTPADARAAARAGLADAVRAARGTRSGTLFVRINPAGSSDFAPDLAAVQGAGVDGLILAKTESAAEVADARLEGGPPRADSRTTLERECRSGFVQELEARRRTPNKRADILRAP